MSGEDPTLKIVLVGESGVGKTTIVNTYLHRATGPVNPTIGGDNHNVEKKFGDKTVKLNIWDTAGQDRYKDIVPMYFRNANVAICVFDITNLASFEKIEGWVNLSRESGPNTVKIVIVGNKTDKSDQRTVNYQTASDKASSLGALFYVETSAQTGEGIDMLFEQIGNEESVYETTAVKTTYKPKEEKSGCC